MRRRRRKGRQGMNTAHASVYNFFGFCMWNLHYDCWVGDHSLCGLMGELNPSQEPWWPVQKWEESKWYMGSRISLAGWSSVSVTYKLDQVTYTWQILVPPFVMCDNESKFLTTTMTLKGIVLCIMKPGQQYTLVRWYLSVGRVLTKQAQSPEFCPQPCIKLSVVVHTCNPSPWEAGIWRTMSQCPPQLHIQFKASFGLQETLSQQQQQGHLN